MQDIQEEIKHQRKLQKTQLDLDIAKAKNDQKKLEKLIKADRLAEHADHGHSDI